MKDTLSRRNFLRGAGGAVSLSWGGLRIFAGSGIAADEAASQTPSPSAQPFIYGTAFYRPPNPPASMRREMLKAIAQKYQFNIVRIYPAWVYYNPAPDRFVFDDLEEVMKYCDEFGLRVLMGIVTEEAPYWLERAHPETRFVDAKGNPQRLSDSSNNVSGGWPGLCLDWDPVQQAAQRFIREIIKVVAPHPSMYAYDCWNEAHIEPSWPRNIWAQPQELLYCYCDQTIAKFRLWLEHRYGSLDALNEAWVRHYSDWNEVDPPRAMGTYTDWIDWRNYIIDRSTWEMQFRVDNIRQADPHHLRESHLGFCPPIDPGTTGAINGWRLAECVQTWGLSNFPRWGSIPPYLGAARFELTRSQAGDKPFWMTELQGGHGSSGLAQSPHMRPRDIRLWNWLASAAGAKGILYWTYHAEATGGEAMGFGLVDRDGSETERVLEAARNNRLIQAHWDILRDYLPKPEVALLTDQDNSILTYAMAGKEDASFQSFRGYYKALWNLDQWADFIEPRSLGEAHYKVVIVPWHLIGKKETCERLLSYVERGGTLILETSFGLFDERCFYNPVIPPYGLAEAFGFREKENYYMRPRADWGTAARPPAEIINFEPDIQFSLPLPVQVRANTYLTPIEISSATPIATCMDLTVGAKKQVGKGEVYYIGTNLGASIAAGSDAGIDLLGAIITPVAPPPVSSTRLRPRLIEGAKGSLLTVFNDTPQDLTESLVVPARFHRATDIHTEKPVAWVNGALQVSVPYEDVLVLLLE
ncbi:MAG: beta-galactosidase [Acidobacteriota bacterium]|nr:beta-galactosidase [Acidobacteriota bacterium]